ncbi:MAG: hypothetical protein U1E84_00220 [Rhodoferax sp.]
MLAAALLAVAAIPSAVPPRSEQLLMIVLVAVEEPSASGTESTPMMWINRATWNRLRREAGVSTACDNPTLALEVVTGAGAKAWGIAAASSVTLAMIEGGMIGVPESILPDETWFVKGVKVVGNPCPPAAPPQG